MSGEWVYDRESLWDFLGFVIECAPGFPQEDYLEPHEQLDIEMAFLELRHGLDLLQGDLKPPTLEACQLLLEQALGAYQTQDDRRGAKLLQDFEHLAFPV